jgi:hypothetical protein
MMFLSVLYIVFLSLVGVELRRRQLKRQDQTAEGAGTEVAAGSHQQPLRGREVPPPGSTSSMATYGGNGTVPRAGEKRAASKGGGGGDGGGPREEGAGTEVAAGSHQQPLRGREVPPPGSTSSMATYGGNGTVPRAGEKRAASKGGGGGDGGGPREERSLERRESGSRISIVVPALGIDLYSSSPIDDLVASISGQTKLPHEVIVVMSGANSSSCSRLHDILARLPPSVDRKLNCTGEEILRQHEARNIGVGMVSGDIVSFIDADDTMHRHKMEITLALFRESPALQAIARNPPEIPMP